MKRLPLAEMHQRHRALTFHVAGSYVEAASVCLSRHHASPARFWLTNNSTRSMAEAIWIVPDERIRDAWANAIDATEAGAYACVIAAAEMSRGLVAVRRAETATGCDYYIGPDGSGIDDLENCIRLEVSGVDAGGPSEVSRRVRQKVEQASKGASSLPALAGVVGFAARSIILRDVPEKA